MCGIFGQIANSDIVSNLISGLKKLEYRGYDSSGISVINSQKKIEIRKAQGKIINLEKKVKSETIKGNLGIAHTRWATHGKPNEENAHPHANQNFSIVHNGIIENYRELKKKLIKEGYKFKSETDTEVIPHLLDRHYKKHKTVLKSIKYTIKAIEGAFALGIISKHEPDKLYATKKGSPLAIGIGKGTNFLASDAYAISDNVDKICYLNDDDIAEISKDNVAIYDLNLKSIIREFTSNNIKSTNVGKENYRHFMLKEIHEQPTVISDIMNTYCNREGNKIAFPDVNINFKNIKNITFIACGSSYYDALTAKNWFENIANISCKIEIASEFLYCHNISQTDLAVFISQSGETADTLKALKTAKEENVKTLAITNVEHSSMSNIADYTINILAGPEIGVASTKAFTAQLVVLSLIALKIADDKKLITPEELKKYCRALRQLPKLITETLHNEDEIAKIAIHLKHIHNILYLGRGSSYGIAKEAALKFQELSYIHAEGIAAGELKHGPIALIDEDLYLVAILPNDELIEKSISNLQEVHARGGKIIIMTEEKIKSKIKDIAEEIIELPKIPSFASPILYSIPAQLLAYHVAVLKGTDVDQPRNLAKSVTVE